MNNKELKNKNLEMEYLKFGYDNYDNIVNGDMELKYEKEVEKRFIWISYGLYMKHLEKGKSMFPENFVLRRYKNMKYDKNKYKEFENENRLFTANGIVEYSELCYSLLIHNDLEIKTRTDIANLNRYVDKVSKLYLKYLKGKDNGDLFILKPFKGHFKDRFFICYFDTYSAFPIYGFALKINKNMMKNYIWSIYCAIYDI